MRLELHVRVDGDVATIAAVGEIDVQTAPLLEEGVDRAVAAGACTIALDLSAVTFIGSSGLGAVLGRFKAVARAGGQFVLVAPTETTRRLLAVTGLDEVLPVCDSSAEVDDAVMPSARELAARARRPWRPQPTRR